MELAEAQFYSFPTGEGWDGGGEEKKKGGKKIEFKAAEHFLLQILQREQNQSYSKPGPSPVLAKGSRILAAVPAAPGDVGSGRKL